MDFSSCEKTRTAGLLASFPPPSAVDFAACIASYAEGPCEHDSEDYEHVSRLVRSRVVLVIRLENSTFPLYKILRLRSKRIYGLNVQCVVECKRWVIRKSDVQVVRDSSR